MRGGGDLHRLQLNHKRRLPQDGPAAAQLRWTTYSGGVFTSFTSKGPRHQGAVWRFNIIYKEQGTISIIELLAHKQNPLQSKQVPGPHADAVSLRPAHALLSFIFENPPPSPHDRPWSTRSLDARSASDQSRERSSQARTRDSR